MRITMQLAIVLALGSLVALAGCGGDEPTPTRSGGGTDIGGAIGDVTKGAGAALDAAQQGVVKTMKTQLDALAKQVDALADKGEAEDKLADAKAAMADLEKADAGSWKDAEAAMKDAMKALQDAYTAAAQKASE